MLEMSVTPDILILPSKLQQFASELTLPSSSFSSPSSSSSSCSVVAVNPQSLTKGDHGGSYALITVHPFNDDEMNMIQEKKESMKDMYMKMRTRVDIVRI